jgi:hypothetical protein
MRFSALALFSAVAFMAIPVQQSTATVYDSTCTTESTSVITEATYTTERISTMSDSDYAYLSGAMCAERGYSYKYLDGSSVQFLCSHWFWNGSKYVYGTSLRWVGASWGCGSKNLKEKPVVIPLLDKACPNDRGATRIDNDKLNIIACVCDTASGCDSSGLKWKQMTIDVLTEKEGISCSSGGAHAVMNAISFAGVPQCVTYSTSF